MNEMEHNIDSNVSAMAPGDRDRKLSLRACPEPTFRTPRAVHQLPRWNGRRAYENDSLEGAPVESMHTRTCEHTLSVCQVPEIMKPLLSTLHPLLSMVANAAGWDCLSPQVTARVTSTEQTDANMDAMCYLIRGKTRIPWVLEKQQP